MGIKRILLLVSVVLCSTALKAQQDPQFTQWFNDKQSFNPAYVGALDGVCGGNHCFGGFFRNQWAGFENADGRLSRPNTFMFNYSGRLQTAGANTPIGIGATFYSDELGQESNTVFRGMGAYHLDAGSGTLSMGIALGFYGKKLGSDWLPPDGIESVSGDPAINNQNASDGSFDLNLGLYYYVPRDYYIGLSTTHLTSQDLTDLNIKAERHYYFMGGKTFNVNSIMDVRTNILAKSDFNKSSLDINANLLYSQMIYGGLSWRPGDAVAVHAGLEYGTSTSEKTYKRTICYRFGYSYDVTTSEIRNYSGGSHELFVGVCFSYMKIPMRVRHQTPIFL
ncbi:MAG: PorP/SprF family type IX secretion system membrane protein [Flavobacteriales bacterium]|nr:PorP/SprF family type IX secretion system membrane protein [Flavobacteriales bacterium]